MRVNVDERRHHGLAREVDAHRAGGRFHIFGAPDACDGAVLDDERGILDGGRPVAGNQRGAYVHRRLSRCGSGDQQGQAEKLFHAADYRPQVARGARIRYDRRSRLLRKSPTIIPQ